MAYSMVLYMMVYNLAIETFSTQSVFSTSGVARSGRRGGPRQVRRAEAGVASSGQRSASVTQFARSNSSRVIRRRSRWGAVAAAVAAAAVSAAAAKGARRQVHNILWCIANNVLDKYIKQPISLCFSIICNICYDVLWYTTVYINLL